MRICALGGDSRFPYATEALRERGHEVSHSAYGDAPLSPEELAGAEAILLPFPASRDGKVLNAPLSPLPVPLPVLFSMIPEHAPILCGRPESLAPHLSEGHPIYDYALSEDYLEQNARITAEGAISLLMQRLRAPLFETPCLVLGSGRIARHLCDLLVGLHAPVAIFARNRDAKMPHGIQVHPLLSLPAEIGKYRVLINTVPAPVLEPPLLLRAPEGGLLLELSAVPGVVSTDACRRAGIELLVAPALPGRYAPEGAGRAIADAVATILSTF